MPEEAQLEERFTENEMDGFECDIGCQGTDTNEINDTQEIKNKNKIIKITAAEMLLPKYLQTLP